MKQESEDVCVDECCRVILWKYRTQYTHLDMTQCLDFKKFRELIWVSKGVGDDVVWLPGN